MVGFADILKLVDHDDGFCFKAVLHDCGKDCVPSRDVGRMEQRASDKVRSLLLEGVAVLRFGFLTGQEEQGVPVLDKLRDQCGLSGAPPPVEDHKGASLAIIFALQGLHLLLAVDKSFHANHILANYYTAKYNKIKNNFWAFYDCCFTHVIPTRGLLYSRS